MRPPLRPANVICGDRGRIGRQLEDDEPALVPGGRGRVEAAAHQIGHRPAQRQAARLRLAGRQFGDVIVERQGGSHLWTEPRGENDVKRSNLHQVYAVMHRRGISMNRNPEAALKLLTPPAENPTALEEAPSAVTLTIHP